MFEKQSGEGELVSQKSLNKIVKKAVASLELVFVAACDSEFIGNIFHKSGARHVICVKQGKHVLDEAAIFFTNRLYKKLFNSCKICDAFIEAKEEVEYNFGFIESDLFTLMTQDGPYGPKTNQEA